ncbi:toprim domain-containing protein [Thermococcus sp. AM4]|uniref:toprim domain-containing protein n=1 Tax=Thermococcus sp. (strain AM4) TaxID=246969 RepID=UPI0002299508|nr:toprim domain-containing protein [Thermococcus sp. AM4]EEB74332.2 Small primase-like proteins (Toprim domain) [Thermococcus sp. AM4]
MYAENYKRFLELIEKLREFEGALIVEGLRDEVALRNLGVRAEIIRLSRLPLAEIALIASRYREVMILTDFDRKGEELARKLVSYLEGYPCRVDAETRRELKRIARKDIKGVEDLYGLYLKVVSVSDPRLEGFQ